MTDSSASEAALPAPPAVENVTPVRSSVQLVAYGIFGAIFVLFAIGWAVALLRDPAAAGAGLDTFMRALGVGVAIAAGPLWFACVFLVTRRKRLFVTILWLTLGVIVTIPWPLISGS